MTNPAPATIRKRRDYQIAALWVEGSLSYLEQLCLKSFVDAGHHVKLYHYGPLQNVPDRIELADANLILPSTTHLTYKKAGSPALQADKFRFRMLAEEADTIWADTDAYCARPFETATGHFYGWESPKHINSGVLGLPKDSATLDAILEFTQDEYAIPLWYGETYRRELQEKADAGAPVHASEQPWGVWGPHILTHFLHETGEAKYALPQEGLYPFRFKDRRLMLKPGLDTSAHVTENTYSIHLYGRRMRARLVEREGGLPAPTSLLGRLLVKHDIDPQAAPLPPPKTREIHPKAEAAPPAQGAQVSLTPIADRHGLERGSLKHGYTDLYQMLFLPYRRRAIRLLEIGAGGAGETDVPPSAQVWLDYFPKASVFGLNLGHGGGAPQDRYTALDCDMEARESLQKLARDLPDLDIIIDDGTHASHHQQNAFVDLFPKLKPGGLYIIEDMRWQPKEIEREGFTKTAALFRGFQIGKAFTHADPTLKAAFDLLAPEISGCFVFQADFMKDKRDQLAVIHKR